MAHSLPFCKPPAPPEPPLPAPRHINASPKSALLVENDESLLNFWRRSLTDEGYAVRTAANSEEGLRLFRDCGPFMVVLIDYCVPQRSGLGVDFLAPLTHGIGLATAIKEINPSQGIIVAALDYWNAAEVPRPQQLMHVPVLTDVSNFQLRRLLEKIEVERRIEMLTIPELLKLRRFGDFRVRGIGRAARGRTGEDLLGEAILRTLIGAENTQKGRHWNRDVDFVRHLAGAMQSICNCWKRQFNEIEAHLVSEFPVHDEEGQERSPLDNVASGHPPVDQCLIEKDEQSRVLSMFNDDHEAAQVLRGLLAGLTKSEIMLSYGLDKNKLAATERRIRVKLGRSDVSRVRKMADKKNQEERLEMVMNHLGESMLAQSDTAILAETSEAGVDPQAEAEQTRLVLRQAAKLFNDVNTRLSSLGHVIDPNDWRRGQRGYHATCLTCGSFASFTTTTGEMRGDALDGGCLQRDHYAIRRREGSR